MLGTWFALLFSECLLLFVYGSRGSSEVSVGTVEEGEVVCQKNQKYECDMEQEEAFQTLKDNLYNTPILSLHDGSENIVIHENNYTTHDLKLGAVVFALKTWRHYLYGTKSVIFTDHKSLQLIFDHKELNMRQRRWIELFSNYNCEIRYHPGKANVVVDALSWKERVKSRRVRAMSMTIQSSIKNKLLAAQNKATREGNAPAKMLCGLDQQIEKKEDGGLYFVDRIWVPLIGDVKKIIMDEAHATRYSIHTRADKIIEEGLKATRVRQKSYADNRRKPLEFKVGDQVLLKVSPWKGMVCFGKKSEIAPRYVGPLEILEKIGPVAYRLRLPQELSSVYDTFHVSSLKKCLTNANLHGPLKGIKVDKTLCFVEEPVEIMDREVKRVKRSRISIFMVRWISKQGLKFTWKYKDYKKAEYPMVGVKF
ncbi:putative reverse transcriptase domain-containing protein [Tanacetum coccineum]